MIIERLVKEENRIKETIRFVLLGLSDYVSSFSGFLSNRGIIETDIEQGF